MSSAYKGDGGGFLIRINHDSGNYVIPTDKFIRAESYKVTMNTNDLDSYRDADGHLHRNALPHKPMKIEFETPPMLTANQMSELLENLWRRMDSKEEQAFSVTCFNPLKNTYTTQRMYMPDPQFAFYGNYPVNSQADLQYSAVRFAFIGY